MCVRSNSGSRGSQSNLMRLSRVPFSATATTIFRDLCSVRMTFSPPGDVCSRRPTVAAITTILKNPAYAGAFVYGRTCQKLSNLPGVRPVKSPRPGMDWRIVVKNKYPAYISWETFEKVKAMLRDNRAEYLRTKSRGIPRDGSALLHGITWCGECGHKMVERYKGGSQYVCNHLHQHHRDPVCQCLRAAPIDTQAASA